MTNILLTNSLTQTTVISFLQNRLKEFGIVDSGIEAALYNLSNNIVYIIKAHFEYRRHLPAEEDLYYDEINFECGQLLTQIKLIKLNADKLKKLVFVVTKVLDQIAIEAKEQQLPVLTVLVIETEKKILDI
jgi:uncharacterized membrane protein YcgQ (UPF0703/DUF1980 family)